jgi:uncharacterized protein YndB with AHSA1/START domain
MGNHDTATETTQRRPEAPGLGDRELLLTRIIRAPRSRVFDAWTDPTQVAAWWGPQGYGNPVCKMDVWPGGRYRIVMRSPDGVDFPVWGTFHEVVEPERLVFTDTWEGFPADWLERLSQHRPRGEANAIQEALNTVTFEDYDGKTRLTIRTVFESRATRDAMMRMGVAQSWAESIDRLERHLAKA